MKMSLASASPRVSSYSPSRLSSQSPAARMPESNFFGGTLLRQSCEESENKNSLPMMQTKENAYKLRAILSQKRVDNPVEKTRYSVPKLRAGPANLRDIPFLIGSPERGTPGYGATSAASD